MKKIILTILINFLLIGNVHALTEEVELEELKKNLKEIEDKVLLLEENRLDKTYPVGSIYITTGYSSVSEVEQNIGGKWEEYGEGKTLFGVDSNDSNFNEINKTAGTSLNTLTKDNLPAHSHNIPALQGITDTKGEHSHSRGTMNIGGDINLRSYEFNHDTILSASGAFSSSIVEWSGSHDMLRGVGVTPAYYNSLSFNAANNWTGETSSNGAHSHTVTTTANTSGSTGSGTAFTNLPPYITVYMYKRVS